MSGSWLFGLHWFDSLGWISRGRIVWTLSRLTLTFRRLILAFNWDFDLNMTILLPSGPLFTARVHNRHRSLPFQPWPQPTVASQEGDQLAMVAPSPGPLLHLRHPALSAVADAGVAAHAPPGEQRWLVTDPGHLPPERCGWSDCECSLMSCTVSLLLSGRQI